MDRSDLATLTAFVAVADQRSFRATAARLDVTLLGAQPLVASAGGAAGCVCCIVRRAAHRPPMQANVRSTSFDRQSIKSGVRWRI
jgi:hypothetical protein